MRIFNWLSTEERIRRIDEEILIIRERLKVFNMWGDNFLSEDDKKTFRELSARLEKLLEEKRKLTLITSKAA